MSYLIQPPAMSVDACNPLFTYTIEDPTREDMSHILDFQDWGWEVSLHRPGNPVYLEAMEELDRALARRRRNMQLVHGNVVGSAPRLTLEQIWIGEARRRLSAGLYAVEEEGGVGGLEERRKLPLETVLEEPHEGQREAEVEQIPWPGKEDHENLANDNTVGNQEDDNQVDHWHEYATEILTQISKSIDKRFNPQPPVPKEDGGIQEDTISVLWGVAGRLFRDSFASDASVLSLRVEEEDVRGSEPAAIHTAQEVVPSPIIERKEETMNLLWKMAGRRMANQDVSRVSRISKEGVREQDSAPMYAAKQPTLSSTTEREEESMELLWKMSGRRLDNQDASHVPRLTKEEVHRQDLVLTHTTLGQNTEHEDESHGLVTPQPSRQKISEDPAGTSGIIEEKDIRVCEPALIHTHEQRHAPEHDNQSHVQGTSRPAVPTLSKKGLATISRQQEPLIDYMLTLPMCSVWCPRPIFFRSWSKSATVIQTPQTQTIGKSHAETQPKGSKGMRLSFCKRRNSEPGTSKWKPPGDWKKPSSSKRPKFMMVRTFSKNKELGMESAEASTPTERARPLASDPEIIRSTLDYSDPSQSINSVDTPQPHEDNAHHTAHQPDIEYSRAAFLQPTTSKPWPNIPEQDIHPTATRRPSAAALLHHGPQLSTSPAHHPRVAKLSKPYSTHSTHSASSSLIFPDTQISEKEYKRRTRRPKANPEPGFAEGLERGRRHYGLSEWDSLDRGVRKLGVDEEEGGKRHTWHDDWKKGIREEEKRKEKEERTLEREMREHERRAEKEMRDEEKRVARQEKKEREERALEELRKKGFVLRYTG